MEKFFSAIVKWVGDHLSPKFLFPITAISGFLLFAPAKWLSFFGLEQIAHQYRGVTSLAFFASALILMAYPASAAVERLKALLAARKSRGIVRHYLENLGVDEISILQQYAESGKSSLHFSPANGTVQGLVDKAILYRPFQQLRGDGLMSFNLTSETKKFMRRDKFQELLNINSENMGFGHPTVDK